VLFVGDDWAEDHHDVEVMDAVGRVLATKRLPEGVAGIAGLHALVGRFLPEDADPALVAIGIETDRGPWVSALIAAGYRVYAINPRQAARFRDRHGVSGAKSDTGDAHALADMVRTDSHQLRQVAGDSDLVAGLQGLARAHQNLIWDLGRHVARLRATLREYYPAALEAFGDLDAPEARELLAKAATPDAGARLSRSQITAALTRAGRRKLDEQTTVIQAALRTEHLGRPVVIEVADAAIARSLIAVISAVTEQINHLQDEVKTHFGRHPDTEIYLSQPGIGHILGARVLAEFGDDPDRYSSAKARKNYAGTSPITIASGKRRHIQARYIRVDRLADSLQRQAFSAIQKSPGARAYHDLQRARGVEHQAALRQLANRLVGILHGCLKTGQLYDEETAWAHHRHTQAA
jgi:hypothetical protein